MGDFNILINCPGLVNTNFIAGNDLNERKLMDMSVNGVEYLPTYEDKDGDWMLVGDVPWK